MSRPQSTRPPVDEDVDDLDDVLDQFAHTPAQAQNAQKRSAASTPAPAPAPITASKTPSTASRPPIGPADLDLGEDFARELAEGMASLMREIAAEAGSGPDDGEAKDVLQTEEDKKREEAFRRAWEEMIVEGLNGEAAPSGKGKEKEKAGASAGAGGAADVKDDKFQSSIKKAMEKLKESESSLKDDAANDDDSLEQMLKSLSEGGGNPEDQLQGMLENMMTQLMSKDVLYEPLKELHEKFPAYMTEKGETLKAEDKKRFEGQQTVVAQIVAIFEAPTYSPEDVEQGVKIVTLMNEMQAFGSPPTEIMGPLPPGLELGQDGLPKLPEGCIIA